MTDPQALHPAERPRRRLVLAGTTLAWLAGVLWAARATIGGRQDAETAVTSTAYALPGAISAALVAGAAVGLATVASGSPRLTRHPTVRFGLTTAAGVLVGLLGALSIININSEGW